MLLTWTLERDKGGGRRDERCINGEPSSGKYAVKSILSTCIYFLATFSIFPGQCDIKSLSISVSEALI